MISAHVTPFGRRESLTTQQRHKYAAKLCCKIYGLNNDVIISKRNGHTFIALEGSDTVRNWLDNFNVKFNKNAHSGFTNYYKTLLNDYNLNDEFTANEQIVLCGHSLGAASVLLLLQSEDVNTSNINEVVLFGCPKIGNHEFNHTFPNHSHIRIFSYIHGKDPVPHLPPTFFQYVPLLPPNMQIIHLDSTQNKPTAWYYQVLPKRIQCWLHAVYDHAMQQYILALQCHFDMVNK